MCGFEPRERQAQFLLPMVVHRRANGFAALRGLERAAKLLRHHAIARLARHAARRPARRLNAMRILVIAPQPFYQERGTPIATRLLVEALQAADTASTC